MILATGEKPLILLVDDVPANLHVLAAALKTKYRIKIATSGQAALDLVALDDKPQLLLLDVMMPGMSGIEVLRQMRARQSTADIPVIFVSADNSEQSQLEGLELGADDYLTKPVVTTVLLARVRNLLQRKRAEAELRLAAHVFNYSGEAIMVSDRKNHILEVNQSFERLTGYTPDEVRGRDPRMLSSGRTPREVYAAMWQALQQNGFWQGEMWDRHKSGEIYPKLLTISVVRDLHGEIEYFIASFTDISQLKAAEDRIRHVAHHDALTGLPNRLYLKIGLDQMLAAARREDMQAAVMFIDLDRFKVINDTLGHHVGDGLLVDVASRLQGCVRGSDLLARLGGDEFVVALTGHEVERSAVHVAEKILDELAQPYHIGEHTLRSTPSIGISLFPFDGDNIDALMKHADTAMYHAKSLGRNNFQFFSDEMNKTATDRLLLENSLHEALSAGQFLLHYQPQVEPKSGRLVGVEALVRWLHPTQGMIGPDRFIPVAEESGLIVPLGEWVLATACAQLRHWRDQGNRDLRMAVNISQHQLHSPRLVGTVAELLERHQLAGHELELEITESVAMKNPQETIRVLDSLRELGVELAIDDFGTGYSSLAYLKLLPIQRLKLDRSFVKDIEIDANDAAISSATIALAHALGLEVVAEGVETEIQREFLQRHGCDLMQGYLFSRPVPADAVLAYAAPA